jgi:hypothetical protein
MVKRLGVKELYVLHTGRLVSGRARRERGADRAKDRSRHCWIRTLGSAGAQLQRTGAQNRQLWSRGVFVGSILPGRARLMRDLRAVLGARFHILASDGFEDFEQLIEEAGRAAEGSW